MSTLRKMGAFLGLVPDDARYGGDRARDNGGDADGYDQHSDYAAADYSASDYRAQGYDAHDYTAEYDDAGDYRGTGYGTSRDADNYGDYRDGADGHGAGRADSTYSRSRYGSDGDTADDYQYGSSDSYRYTDAGYRDANGDTAIDDAAAPVSRRADSQPPGSTATLSARSGRRDTSRDSDRGAGDQDFRTQGALAVQPEPYQQPVAETASKPVTVTLTGFADARQVGETYRDGTAVILDMTDLTDAEARRMVDFAAGLAFAVHGSIDKVTTKVFMLHPPAAS